MPEYMNNMGSYPQYGMVPQLPQSQPFDALQNQYLQQYNNRMQQLGMLQNPMQTQYRQPTQPQNSGLTVRPATNIQEVQATPIELMTTNLFVNLAQGEIYLSRINDSGLKDIAVYKLQTDIPADPATAGMTSPQIDLGEIYARFDRLENMIGGKANESDPVGNASNAKRGKPSGDINATAGTTGTN